jgi:ribosomal protein S12 methylthiotransferase accessory factor
MGKDYVHSIATFLEGRSSATAASLVSPIGGVVSHVRAYDAVEGDGGHLVYAAFAGRGRHPEHAPQLIGVGVGADDDAAADDALRRALGLYAAAAWDAKSMRWASADELGDEALPVEELPRLASLETRDRVRWVEGFALDDGRPIWVPAILAHLALPVAVEAEAFWAPSTSGLAVADDLGTAVLVGLLDLVARDAFAVASTRDAPLPRLTPPGDDRAVFDATTDLGIPTALAQGAASFEFGMGAAATMIGARGAAVDDLVRRRARRARDAYPAEPAPDPAFDPGAANTEVDAPSGDESAVDLSKPAIVARLRRVGLAGYAVDLTTDELAAAGLSAVRVVVPGLSPIPPSPGWSDHARLARVAG